MKTLSGEEICYHCKKLFSDVGVSNEHIIPDALGGKGLVSRNLLCEKCNNEWAASIDNVLIAQLGSLADFIGVPRDRKNDSKQIPVSSDNPELKSIRLGGRGSYKIQIQSSGINIPPIEATTKEDALKKAKKIIKELARKYPQFLNADIEKETVWSRGGYCKIYMGNHLINGKRFFKIGGVKFFQGITKILVNYAGAKGVPYDELENPLHFLIEGGKFNHFIQPYYLEFDLDLEPISHTIYLKGCTKDHLLIAYLELFDTFCFIALLNSNYHGPEIESSVSFDLLTGQKKQPRIEIGLSFDRLHSIPYWSRSLLRQWGTRKDLGFQKRNERLFVRIQKIQSDREAEES